MDQCYTLAEYVSTFCLYPETLQETEVRGSELIILGEEIQDNPTFKLWHRHCWLDLARFTVRIKKKGGGEKLEKHKLWHRRNHVSSWGQRRCDC